MAYGNRRFKRSYSRAGSSRFRSRLRTPTRNQRWSRAQFALEPELSVDSPLDAGLTVVPLAQIANHLLGGTTTSSRLSSNQLMRHLEIGGIVFDLQFLVKPESNVVESPDWAACAQCILYSDRLDDASNPVALSTNWFTNTLPITLSSATEAQDEDDIFPTRVHFRRACALSSSFWIPSTSSPGGLAQNPVAVRTQWSQSIRLRLRLDDAQALCVAFALTAFADYPTLANPELRVKMLFVGSLYYRVRM